MIKPFEKRINVTKPLFPPLKDYKNRLEKVWQSDWLTNFGEQHKLLEKKLKKYLNVKNLLLINNGTIALQIALKALDISGEVVTTPFTFSATTHAIKLSGATPVFCDIKQKDLVIDEQKIEDLVTPRTEAILPVHVFGIPCNVKKIRQIADKYNLKVIYDAAHAFGTKIDDISIGNFGDLTCFSFHATKLFNTAEGGAIATSDEYLKKKIDLIRNFGLKNKVDIVVSGTNGKMNELQAAMGIEVLKLVKRERKKRKKIKKVYENALENIEGINILKVPDRVKNSLQYFVVRFDKKKLGVSRDFVYKKLKDYNVYSRRYFYPLTSNIRCYNENSSAKKEYLPVANRVVDEVLSLPFYGKLKLKDVNKICKIIKEIIL